MHLPRQSLVEQINCKKSYLFSAIAVATQTINVSIHMQRNSTGNNPEFYVLKEGTQGCKKDLNNLGEVILWCFEVNAIHCKSCIRIYIGRRISRAYCTGNPQETYPLQWVPLQPQFHPNRMPCGEENHQTSPLNQPVHLWHSSCSCPCHMKIGHKNLWSRVCAVHLTEFNENALKFCRSGFGSNR